MNFSYYVHTSPNSHFYTDLEMLRNTLANVNPTEHSINYVRIGIENTIKQGYKLVGPQAAKVQTARYKIGERVKYQIIDAHVGEVVSVTYTKAGVFYSILEDVGTLRQNVPEKNLYGEIKE